MSTGRLADSAKDAFRTAGELARRADEPPQNLTIADKVMISVAEFHKKPVPTQMAIGGSAGIVTGYIFTRGSKATAAVLGVSLLALQFASYKGYIVVNDVRLKNDIRNISAEIEKKLSGRRSVRINKDTLADYLTDNAWLIGGFTAGWLIGYSFA